jgi:hypothetical protein
MYYDGKTEQKIEQKIEQKNRAITLLCLDFKQETGKKDIIFEN